MALTVAEKKAGRCFKAEQTALLYVLNTKDPPTFDVPSFLAIFRHLCPARNNLSTAMELQERYITSPPYPEEGVPAGRFAYLYREGQCSHCGRTARSGMGRLVDAHERPTLIRRNRS